MPAASSLSAEADPEIPPGSMVGEYQVLGLLGTGGMGSVYAGVQPVIGKRVAIKVLLRELAANPQVVNRFMQEARAVNQAQSRYIVDIFSFGELPDRRQYFVMEYLQGLSLRQFLHERKTLSFEEAFAILTCVCKGLAAAHNKGIIHRDIKPENIMVRADEDGSLTAKILDFGIAKLQSGEGSQPGFATRTGAAMGTPYYMSPEQCRGVAVDHRTDIYALGIIMFEMFTGALPFTARSYIDLVNKHLFAHPPLPSKLRNNISPGLEALILRCIAKDPNERPGSIEEVLDELHRTAPSLRGATFTLEPRGIGEESDEPIPPMTGPARAFDVSVPLAGRRRVALFLVGLVTVLLGGGAAVAFLLLRDRGGEDRPRAAVRGQSNPDQKPTLRITSRPPGARVFLDGAAQPGTTPLVLEPEAGSHELRVELAGHKAASETLSLAPGRQHSVTYVLLPAEPPAAARPGRLRVRTGIRQAIYFIDGAEVGRGVELDLPAVKAGSHQLRVAAPLHKEHEQAVALEPGATLRLELQMRPLRNKAPRKKVDKGKGGTQTEDPDGTLDPFTHSR